MIPPVNGNSDKKVKNSLAPGKRVYRLSGSAPRRGLLHELRVCVSLFQSNIGIYEVHNNGAWYNFGNLFGLACFFNGGDHQAARRRKTAVHG